MVTLSARCPSALIKNLFDAVIIPKYMCMKEEFKNQLQYITFYMDIGYRRELWVLCRWNMIRY